LGIPHGLRNHQPQLENRSPTAGSACIGAFLTSMMLNMQGMMEATNEPIPPRQQGSGTQNLRPGSAHGVYHAHTPRKSKKCDLKKNCDKPVGLEVSSFQTS
jgi:hypothetical protein